MMVWTTLLVFAWLAFLQDPSPPKQAVVETSVGTFVIDLTPETAPNQTAHFIALAAAGAYDGTAFHRVIEYGMVQGGDPPTKDPSKRALYGTGGAQTSFFICTGTSPTLDGVDTAFGRVVDGMPVVEAIEASPRDGETPRARIDLNTVRIEKK